MREIKFRAYIINKEKAALLPQFYLEENNWMFPVDGISFNDKMTGIYDKVAIRKPNLSHALFDIVDVILMQFTGMKDSYGKEIFEGDIVKFSRPFVEDIIGRVFWDEDRHTLKIRWNGKDYWYDWFFSEIDSGYNLEVIGNIHQNKELFGENNETV